MKDYPQHKLNPFNKCNRFVWRIRLSDLQKELKRVSKVGRVFLVVVVIVGLIVAWVRLGEQNVPAWDVLSTGLLFLLSLVALFGVLIGAGKLLGRLFNGE